MQGMEAGRTEWRERGGRGDEKVEGSYVENDDVMERVEKEVARM